MTEDTPLYDFVAAIYTGLGGAISQVDFDAIGFGLCNTVGRLQELISASPDRWSQLSAQLDHMVVARINNKLKPQQPGVSLDRTRTRSWVIRGAKISSADERKSFESDLLIDTGCKVGQLRLPPEKCQQLGLQKEREGKSTQGKVIFYSPVNLQLVCKDGSTVKASLNPFSHPLETTSTTTTTATTTTLTTLTTTTTTSTTTPPTTTTIATTTTPKTTRSKRRHEGGSESKQKRRKTVVTLSPVKHPSTQGYSTILLGPNGFGAFGLELDTRSDQLYYEEEVGAEFNIPLSPPSLIQCRNCNNFKLHCWNQKKLAMPLQ